MIMLNPSQPSGTAPEFSNQHLAQTAVQRGYSAHDSCIHHEFEAQVEKTPEAIALTDRHQSLTYRSLNQQANQLAHHLRRLGVQPDEFVGLYVERSPDLIIGLLGILKAGAAYLPLDPTYPAERLTLILEDAQPQLVLTQAVLEPKLPPTAAMCLCLDEPENWAREHHNPTPLAQPHHLAYLIYTSGSTGRPKGVMIEHASLSHFAQASRLEYGIQASDRVLQFASISFDAAAEEIYPCLISGGELVLRSPEMMSSIPCFLQQCRNLGLTVLDLPTAYWHLLVSELTVDPTLSLPESIRIVIIGGEAVSPQRVAQWQQQLWRTGHRAQLINTYGPTEATVVATAYKFPLPKAEPPAKTLPRVTIGRALPQVQTYLLDAQQQPVPPGTAGELCIGGAGVARGYWGQPELTAERFLPDPFAAIPGARLYRTGDLARQVEGELEFLGRMDNQVKIRGFRVELGEIEAVLTQQDNIQDAAVVLREDKPGHKQLVAYLVPRHRLAWAIAPLHQALKAQLPEYMMPAAFVCLEALPLTPSQKIDRRSLPLPTAQDFPSSTRPFVAPTGATEIQLARLWQTLLGVEWVGATDNFFELGGTSLLAVQLFMQIERRFDRSLQLSALLQAPTVRSLARLLTQTAAASETVCTTIISLQPQGSLPPVFFINSVSYAQRLVSHLGPEQPFYCLNLFGATDLFSLHLAHLSLAQMAEKFVEDLRSVQPRGPYYFCAYCWDSKLAIAIGDHLQRQGHTVALQIFIDPMWDKPTGPGFFWHNLRRFGPSYIPEKLFNRLRVFREQAIYRSRRRWGKAWGEDTQQLQRDLQLYARYQKICSDDQPAPYPGRVTIILCEELFPSWPIPHLIVTLSEPPDVRIVPGYHHTLFHETQLPALAAQIQSVLEAARVQSSPVSLR